MTNIDSAFYNYDETVEKSKTSYSGLLGLAINGNRIVNHPTRAGYVYVRLRDNLSEVVQAFNDKVSPVYDFPVLIQRKGNRWYVLGRDDLRYESWGTSAPYLPRHGDQHSFNRDGGGGGDVTWVYPDQFMPLLVYPSGTYGASNLLVAPYVLQKSDRFMYVGNTGTANIARYKPTTNSAIMGLVYLDRETGNPGFLINSGTPFSGAITGTNAVVPYLPYPSATQEPLYAFRLVSGTTSLTWSNLYNVRQFIGGSTSTGTNSGVPAGLDTQIQFNNTGTFGADTEFTYDKTYNVLEVGGTNWYTGATRSNSVQVTTESGGASSHVLLGHSYQDGTGNFLGVPSLGGDRAGGSKATPTAVLNDMGLVRLIGGGYDGTTLSGTRAQIVFKSTADWTASSHPTNIEFWTTPSGSTIRALTFVVGTSGVASNITAGKTLTLTATNDYTLTVPATGTAALLATANVFTANQTLGGASDPTLILNEGNTGTSLFEIKDTSSTTSQIKKTSASGSTVIDIDPIPSDGTSVAYFRFFRSTNTSGEVSFYVYKGNNTATANARFSGNNDSYVCLDNGNFGIGTSTFGTSAVKVLAIKNGTEPTTSPADTLQIFAVDLSAGNSTLGLRTETAVVTETVTSDRTLSVKINGTTYKICLKA